MASLKHIMNLEDEPLPPRSFETNQQQVQPSRSLPELPQLDTRYTNSRYPPQQPRLPPIDTLPISTSISPQTSPPPFTAKRSRPAPKTPVVSALDPLPGSGPALGLGSNPSNPSSPPRHRTSVGTVYMDPRYCEEGSISPSAGYSSSNSMGRGSIEHLREATQPGLKLTPITGRISKAKKGLPVHSCQQCNRKPFSRAEHLRRHMQSHEPPRFPCKVPNCDKAFHRKDLLERHLEKHNEPQASHHMADNVKKSGSSSAACAKYEPPQTPPQQEPYPDSMSVDAPICSFSMMSAPTRAPIDTNMMMGHYSPVSAKTYRIQNSHAANSQSYQQAQQFQPSHNRRASPMTLSMDSSAPYSQISPIVTCMGTAPPSYVTSSRAYTLVDGSAYSTNAGFNPYTHVPMSHHESMDTFAPHLANHVSQRLLSVEGTQPTPHYTSPHSPLYHSDGTNSNQSTPSDRTGFQNCPVSRERALSAPGCQYMMDLNLYARQQQQQQQQRQEQMLRVQQAGCGLVFEGQNFAVCNDDSFEDQMHYPQQQFQASGGGPVQQTYLEGLYEQDNGEWNC